MEDNKAAEISKVLLYTTSEGRVDVSVYFYEESFWLTQKAMGELFDVESNTITYHLQKIFESEELDVTTVTRNFRATASDGKAYNTNFYNLDAIISVGYRVNSKKATLFRRWATDTLKQYMVKGFVLNDEMLKNGKPFGKDYFDELLERIKEIRASERRFYQKITDIYSQCSYDYNKNSKHTEEFFKTVQNKLLFAITGKTAPELLTERINSDHENMGLTSWRNAPSGKILKADVTVSKNVLSQSELSNLNDIVNMYLDYAENQAKRNKLMSMNDWIKKLDAFLQFNEYDILNNFGKITREVANELATTEYAKFRIKQDASFSSDFDNVTKKYIK